MWNGFHVINLSNSTLYNDLNQVSWISHIQKGNKTLPVKIILMQQLILLFF